MNDFNPLSTTALTGKTAQQTNQHIIGLTAVMTGLLKTIYPKLEAKVEVAMAQQLLLTQSKQLAEQVVEQAAQQAMAQQAQALVEALAAQAHKAQAHDVKSLDPQSTSQQSTSQQSYGDNVARATDPLAVQPDIMLVMNRADDPQSEPEQSAANDETPLTALEKLLNSEVFDDQVLNPKALHELSEQVMGLASLSELIHALTITEQEQMLAEKKLPF